MCRPKSMIGEWIRWISYAPPSSPRRECSESFFDEERASREKMNDASAAASSQQRLTAWNGMVQPAAAALPLQPNPAIRRRERREWGHASPRPPPCEYYELRVLIALHVRQRDW